MVSTPVPGSARAAVEQLLERIDVVEPQVNAICTGFVGRRRGRGRRRTGTRGVSTSQSPAVEVTRLDMP